MNRLFKIERPVRPVAMFLAAAMAVFGHDILSDADKPVAQENAAGRTLVCPTDGRSFNDLAEQPIMSACLNFPSPSASFQPSQLTL